MDTRQKSENVFKEFLELIMKLTSNDKDLELQLQKCYKDTNPHFRWSRGFINLVSMCSDQIMTHPDQKLIHIKEFTDQLTQYKAKPLKHLIEKIGSSSDSDDEQPPLPKRLCLSGKKKAVRSESLLLPQSVFAENNKCRGLAKSGTVGEGSSNSSTPSDEVEPGSIPSTDDIETRKRKRWFYNSASIPLADSTLVAPVPKSHKKSRLEKASLDTVVNEADIICLDDDDDDDVNNDDKDVKMNDAVSKGNGDITSSGKLVATELNSLEMDASKSEKHPLNTTARAVCAAGTGTKKNRPSNDSGPSKSCFTKSGLGDDIEIICLDDEDEENGDTAQAHDSLVMSKDIRREKRSPGKSSSTEANDDVIMLEMTETSKSQAQKKNSSSNNGQSKCDEIKDSSALSRSRILRLNRSAVYTAVENKDGSLSNGAESGNCSDQIKEYGASGGGGTDRCGPKGRRGLGNRGQLDSHGLSAEDKVDAKRKMKYLENRLQKLSSQIEILRRTELTLDDMNLEESSYIEETRLKKKFISIWRKLCGLANRSLATDRPVDRKFTVEVFDYPKVGESVSEFINKDNNFPDYWDIHEVVVSCNSRFNLMLT